MTGDVDDMSLEGAIAPPRANGEILFEAPWQSRVFGMARCLCEQGQYSWDEFRARLIEVVSAADAAAAPGDEYHYFDHFLEALTAVLEDKQLCNATEVNLKTTELSARPHGHDH